MADLSRLEPSLAAALDQARRQLARDGINLDDYVTSGYRTYGEQARLYAQRGSNPNPVASPGSSPHEKGSAVDIPTDSLSSFLREKIVFSLTSAGLYRPLGNRDPVHWQLRPGGVPVLPPGGPLVLPTVEIGLPSPGGEDLVGGAPEAEWVAMSSSMITGAEWRSVGVGAVSDVGTLEVEFVSGRRYSYSSVPRDVWRGLVSAGSKGSYMRSLVIGIYSFA